MPDQIPGKCESVPEIAFSSSLAFSSRRLLPGKSKCTSRRLITPQLLQKKGLRSLYTSFSQQRKGKSKGDDREGDSDHEDVVAYPQLPVLVPQSGP
jgi:hypothetical protein